MAKRKRHPDSKPYVGLRLLYRIAIVLFILFCSVSIVMVQNSIAEKKVELAGIEEQIDALKAENEELADLIKSEDISRYLEKLAVENNGYAYPDERRYYDISHN